jgi:hypothetical protein
VSAPATFEPGSFRDPDGRVFVAADGVYRTLSQTGLEDWDALVGSRLLEELSREGLLIGTELAADDASVAAIVASLPSPPAAVLRHERIPFISYPYEWPFAMLRDAALLQLDLLERALERGLMMKDASSYNVQWRGVKPVFIDVSSFERLREGEPWTGYRQFCMLYLYPLMLQAYRGIDFQPLLRGAVDGIPPDQARAMLAGAGNALRSGVFSHVRLHARLEGSNAERAGEEVRDELKKADFKTELIRSNVKRLHKLVGKLEWEAGRTAWTAYRAENTYSDSDAQAKAAFVRAAAAESHSRLTWDLGCNDGSYARIAAEHADDVIALDSDHATVDALYRSLRETGEQRILPLVGNITDPSPGLGWRGAERRPLIDRGSPDLVLALALVHHLSITDNVPLRELLDWFASLGARLVIEFPARDDPMVKRLLSAKRDGLHADFELAEFERLLGERFTIDRRETLPSETRVLFLARPL